MKVNLSFPCNRVEVTSGPKGTINVEITGGIKHDILNFFSVPDVVDHFNNESLLNRIGKEAAMAHFDLKEI